ncbi:MAG TPA: carbohydrate ABC transporter permease, partial [Herpetosiphonaceae bacterium]|nr:carbohydrate ABC transporter permease [Herpetosiphonaceae bacterium]
KYRFPGRTTIFGLFLLVLMVPYHVTAVPLFRMMASFTWFSDSNWISSYQAVILPALANPFGIFLMRQSMQALPDDLLDAGRIDGASEWRVFWNVALPTMRPTLAALGIYAFMFQWNSFFWPLIIMRDKAMETLPVRINALVGLSIIDYGQLMMGTALTTLPIMMIFLAFQRQFISGAMAGAVKG